MVVMGFNLLLADNDANYSSLLKRGLRNAEYRLFQAESREMALQYIVNCRIDAAIVDLDLPGGVKEILHTCENNSIPLVTTGNQSLDDSEYLIEIMYYGIPYFTKLDTAGVCITDTIISRINRMLKSVIIFSNNKDYRVGVVAGFSINGYNVIIADKTEDLEYLYTTKKPQAIVLYFPKYRDLHSISKIRKMNGNVPILVVARDYNDHLNRLVKCGAITITTQDMVVHRLEDIWLRPCSIKS
jgi:DNA-binding response OmpR family regulator